MQRNYSDLHQVPLISHFLTCLVLLVVIPLCFSCNSQKGKITIGFSQITGSDGWRISQIEEMRRELAFHSEARLVFRDAGGDANKQISQVEDLITQGVDVLIICPLEAQALTPIVNKVYKMGIPVIILDRNVNSNLYTAHIGANNRAIGELAGKYIARILDGKGKVAEVQGLSTSTPARERHEGFISSLSRFPDIRVTDEIHVDWTPSMATKLLKENKDKLLGVDVVYAHNDPMAFAAYSVFNEWGEVNTKFIGTDASPGPNLGLSWVFNNILTASVLYPTGGKEAIETAIKAAKGEQVEKDIVLSTQVIDSTNVELMKLQTDKILGQQKDIEKQQSLISQQLKIYKNQKSLLIIVGGILIISLFLGALFYNSLKQNKRITKALRQKNRKIVNQRNKVLELSEKNNKATETKLNFFTNVSHEFRTPLTLINGALEEIFESDIKKSDLLDNLILIKKSADRLYRMINQLIDYRKVDVQKMKLHVSRVDIIAFIRNIMSLFKSVAEKRNLDFSFRTDIKEQFIWFDPYMIDKVVFNLLSNAFKYTEDYGKISISVKRFNEKESFIIYIEDNGCGISKEETDKIFEPFFQGKGNHHKGFGLGLSMAKHFMQLHHGKLILQESAASGSKFGIYFRLGKSHFSPEEINEKLNTVVTPESTLKYPPRKKLLKPDDLISKTPNPPLFTVTSILIIEDDESLLSFIERRLGAKYDVITARNGEDGLKKAFDIIPDLIISDIVLPQKDGLLLTQIFKTNIRTSHIPIILLTALGATDQQIKGMQAKADYYIIKPFKLKFLESIISSLLQNRVSLKEHYTTSYDTAEMRLGKTNKANKRFLNELNAYIDEELENPNLKIDDICKHIGISRVQLYRKVKALAGCSVNEFIIEKRLNKAKSLLIDGKLNISEISYTVGFSSPSYFSTVFKKKLKKAPNTWRKSKT